MAQKNRSKMGPEWGLVKARWIIWMEWASRETAVLGWEPGCATELTHSHVTVWWNMFIRYTHWEINRIGFVEWSVTLQRFEYDMKMLHDYMTIQVNMYIIYISLRLGQQRRQQQQLLLLLLLLLFSLRICQVALVLFSQMEEVSVSPDIISYNALISSCNGRQWQRALNIFTAMWLGCSKSVVCWSLNLFKVFSGFKPMNRKGTKSLVDLGTCTRGDDQLVSAHDSWGTAGTCTNMS